MVFQKWSKMIVMKSLEIFMKLAKYRSLLSSTLLCSEMLLKSVKSHLEHKMQVISLIAT